MATQPTLAPVRTCKALAINKPIQDFPLPVGDSIITERAAGSVSPAPLQYEPLNMSKTLLTIRVW